MQLRPTLGALALLLITASSQAFAQPVDMDSDEGDVSIHQSKVLRGAQYDHTVYPTLSEDPNLFARDIEPEDTTPPIEPKASVNFVTGGVGEDERAAIEAAKADYNVHITSARNDGAFVDDAYVTITTKAGEEVLEAMIGPLLYVQLPAGSYVLEATARDQKKTHNFTITSAKKTANIHLTWKPITR